MGTRATKADRYLLAVKRNLAAELSTDAEICPKCGIGWVFPDTKAGRAGVCQSCWTRALTDAQYLATREMEARREYDKVRQKKSRAAKSGKKR